MRVAPLIAVAGLAVSAAGAQGAVTTPPPPIAFASTRVDRDLVIIRPDGSGRRVLTPSAWSDGTPSWSPDGARVAFSRFDGTGGRINVVDLRTGRVRDLGLGWHPDWSPDGKRLVFVRGSDLITMRANGTGKRRLNLRRVGVNIDSTDPAWSPDGRLIAFSGDGLFVVRPDGRNLRRLRRESRGGTTWSPDGRTIAFDCRAPRITVCTIHTDGSRLRGLTNRGSSPAWSPRGDLIAVTRDSPPATSLVRPNGRLVRVIRGTTGGKLSWSPNGRRLVLEYDIGANAVRLYATARTRSRLARLTHDPRARDAAPAWSPDGRRIAFRRREGGRCSLVVLNVGPRRVRPLVRRTTDTFCDDRPDWSYDGKRIVYASGGDLWVVPSRGGRALRLTETPIREGLPRWAPDRRSIGFLAPDGIWLLEPEGLRTLLVPGGGPFAWSHDGTMLAYLLYDENRQESDLFLREGDTPPRRLLQAVGDTPTWSPDDRRIAIATGGSSNGGSSILIVTDLGGHASDLFDEAAQPDWRP